MEPFLPYVAGAVTALVALAASLRGHAYWQRRQRLRLRLLTGRRTLLAQEIGSSSRQLADLEGGDLSAVQAATDDAINSLHASLLERQAHLQNYEDLANLQCQKIASLGYRLTHLDSPSGDSVPETDSVAESPGEHRERVQAELLERIQATGNNQSPPGDDGT